MTGMLTGKIYHLIQPLLPLQFNFQRTCGAVQAGEKHVNLFLSNKMIKI